MAPDYAPPVETVDYGDMPGGGVRLDDEESDPYGDYNGLYDLADSYGLKEVSTQPSRSVRHLKQHDKEIETYPDVNGAMHYEIPDNSYEDSYSYNYDSESYYGGKGLEAIDIFNTSMEDPKPPVNPPHLAGHQKVDLQMDFIKRSKGDTKLLLQDLKDLSVKFDSIEWRFEPLDPTSKQQPGNYFHHDDSTDLQKTFLLLFGESSDGKYILSLLERGELVFEKMFHVQTVDEICECVFGGQNTRLPTIIETTLPEKSPRTESNRTESPKTQKQSKSKPAIESTIPPPEISDQDRRIPQEPALQI